MWQDTVMALVQVGFIFALVPSLYAPQKPTLLTSIPTALGLCAIGFTMYTLGLYFSAVTATIAGLVWAALADQKMRSK